MVFGWSFSGHQTQDAQAYHWCELSKERAPQVSPFCYSPGRSRGSLAVVWQEEMLTSIFRMQILKHNPVSNTLKCEKHVS